MNTSELEFPRNREDGLQLQWNQSSLLSLMTCQRYYKLTEDERWTKDRRGGGKATNLVFGQEYHTALENLLKGMPLSEVLRAAWAGAYSTLNLDTGDNARTLARLIRGIIWYEEQYRNDVLRTAILENGKPALEVHFDIPTPHRDIPFRFSGIVDWLVWWEGQLYISDHKTTKKTLNQYYYQEFSPNLQVVSYIWSLRKMGLDVRGFIINAFQTAVSFSRFDRHIIEINQAEVDEFEHHLYYWLDQYIEAFEADYFAMNFQSCTAFGGCRMREICGAAPDQRQGLLEDNYVRKPQRVRVPIQPIILG